MASLRDIKRRIRSVTNTSKITKAMQMVASAKMRRAQELALRGREYIAAIANVFEHLQETIAESASPLMQKREQGKVLVLVINTDRGLCGGLNSNLMREVLLQAPADADYITIGAKLNAQIAKAGRNLAATYSLGDDFTDSDLKPVLDHVRDSFTDGTYREVLVAYQSFVNIMVQKPYVESLLPITKEELLAVAGKDDMPDTDNGNFILEPNPAELLNAILPIYFSNAITQLVLEGKASEQCARMVAMKAATENAKTLIGDLTLEYNKARQAQITNELLEITTAMKAME